MSLSLDTRDNAVSIEILFPSQAKESLTNSQEVRIETRVTRALRCRIEVSPRAGELCLCHLQILASW
jgi:hypothetical protein